MVNAPANALVQRQAQYNHCGEAAPKSAWRVQRLLAASAAGRPPSLVLARDCDSLLSPRTQGLWILEEILRDLIVLHCSAGVAEGTKWSHSARFELWTRRLISLEVNRVIRNQSEEHLARVEPYAAKHGPRADPWHGPTQLIEDENSKARTDRHGP